MTLGELIAELKKHPADKKVPIGFGTPMSYRGYYEQLAFSPMRDTTVGAMLKEAEGALGATFHGYKGGDYKMVGMTDVWLAYYGQGFAETIGPTLLSFMLGEPRFPEDR